MFILFYIFLKVSFYIIKMGAKGSLCQAVTTEDDYLEIDTP